MVGRLVAFGLGAMATISACSAAGSGTQATKAGDVGSARKAAAGIYLTTKVLMNESQLPSPTSYDARGVDGVFLRIAWDAIQPAPDRYDWRLFDSVARTAVAKGKKLSIGVVAGSQSPAWLASAGVPNVSFTFGKRCMTEQVPAAWTPQFVAAYGKMIDAVKAHMVATGTYNAVTMVKVSGLTQRSLELGLPKSNKCSQNLDAQMAQAGYRPGKTLAAWNTMAGDIAAAFPGKLVVQPIFQAQGFPAIGDDGQPIPKGQVDLGNRIVASCIQRFGGRCGIQWNALKAQGRMADRVIAARDKGATIGWQSNLYEGPQVGAGCQVDRRAETVPCTDQSYAQLLARGVALGATFIEVWEPDVLKYRGAFAQTQRDWRM